MSLATEREMLRKLALEARAAARAARAARRRKPTPEEEERRLRGVCRDCDAPVTGRPKIAKFCTEHRRADQRRRSIEHAKKTGYASKKKYDAKNRDTILRKARAYYEDPAVRERRNQYKREWRIKNRDKIRAQKRRAALRAENRPKLHQQRIKERIRAGVHKPKPTKRNKNGERLCLAKYCRVVLTGRPKLCAKHRAAVPTAHVIEFPKQHRGASYDRKKSA